MEANPIRQVFQDWGRQHGFMSHASELVKRYEETVVMLQLQRSRHASRYYLNVGFGIRRLHDKPATQYKSNDISLRAENLMGNSAASLPALLDLRCALDFGSRQVALRACLDDLLPALEQGSTVDGLRTLWADGEFRAAQSEPEVRALLSAEESLGDSAKA
jgi:hypothetical protein